MSPIPISILGLVVLAIVAANAFNKCPLWPAVLVLALLQFFVATAK